jgi:hypothetical protein
MVVMTVLVLCAALPAPADGRPRDASAIVYSSYLGGSGYEYGRAVAVDANGSAWVTGFTASSDFPATDDPIGPVNHDTDVFVAKLSPDGSALEHATYVGGSSGDYGTAIAIDRDGGVYLTGQTFSPDFPTTPGAFDTTYNGGNDDGDAFVVKLGPTGALEYSTFLGGSDGWGHEEAEDIAVDRAGSVYVSGVTLATDFPTTPDAFDRTMTVLEDGYAHDVFVSKLNPQGSALVYSTYLGGHGGDSHAGIAVDSRGSAYVSGLTSSEDLPVTAGAFDPVFNQPGGATQGWDVFVAKLDPAGSGLGYLTYLGGAGQDLPADVAVGPGGAAYVSGATFTPDFPVTAGAADPVFDPACEYPTGESFVAKLRPSGRALVYSTFVGAGCDGPAALALDPGGSAYAAGRTHVTRLGPSGSRTHAVTLGGTLIATDIAAAARRTAYLTGAAFQGLAPPPTPGAFDDTLDGWSDAIALKVDLGSSPGCPGGRC